MSRRFHRIAYQRIGKYLERHNLLPHFTDLRLNLQRAGMDVSLLMYLSSTIVRALVSFGVVLVALVIAKIIFPVIPWVLVLIFPIIIGTTIYLVFISYPYLKVSERKRKLDAALPAAASYMAAMASAGVTPDKIFLSMARQELGEVIVEEAKKISRDIELFNSDVIRALSEAAKRSPSHLFSNFLEGMIATFTSGGDLQAYLETSANNLMREKLQQQRNFIESLGLVAELFLVACVVLPVFFIVMLAMISLQGTFQPTMIIIMLFVMVFVIVPVLESIILLMVDGLQPED